MSIDINQILDGYNDATRDYNEWKKKNPRGDKTAYLQSELEAIKGQFEYLVKYGDMSQEEMNAINRLITVLKTKGAMGVTTETKKGGAL